MAKTETDLLDDAQLEAFFEAGREDVPELSDSFMAALLQDADLAQPQPAALASPRVKRSLWQDIIAQIGGWPALAGMATATVAGVWIGFAAPDQLETLSGGVLLVGDYASVDTIYDVQDFAPNYFGTDLLIEEEG